MSKVSFLLSPSTILGCVSFGCEVGHKGQIWLVVLLLKTATEDFIKLPICRLLPLKCYCMKPAMSTAIALSGSLLQGRIVGKIVDKIPATYG